MSYNMNGTINILFNGGDNNFGNETMIAKRGTEIVYDPEGRINPHLTTADYDMDGDIDLLLGDNSGKVEIFENDGTGNFTTVGVIHDFGSLSWGLTSGDFDNDGYIDFIVAAELKERQAHGRYYLKRNNGLSTCFEPGAGEIIGDIYSSSASLTSLDYDNDGYMDFIAGIMNKAFLFLNNLEVYEPLLIIEFPENPEGYREMLTYGGLTTADYNNDGWDDFVAGGVQGVVRLFINNGYRIPPNK